MTSKKTILYILGQGHTGSTVLSALLGRHSGAVALGEAHRNLGTRAGVDPRDDKDRMCSCGVRMHDCVVWGPYLAKPEVREAGYLRRYAALINDDVLAGYQIVVDASKGLEKLKRLRVLEAEGIIDLHVVFLLKDVRAWIVSALTTDLRKRSRSRSRLAYGLTWYRENTRMKRFLEEAGVAYSQVAYEALCHDPAGTAARILAEAGVSPDAFDMAQPSNIHAPYGNRVRSSPSELANIAYDFRWMQDYWINVVVALLPPVFMWSRANVHGAAAPRVDRDRRLDPAALTRWVRAIISR